MCHLVDKLTNLIAYFFIKENWEMNWEEYSKPLMKHLYSSCFILQPRTWKLGHCLWSLLCRWGNDVGWQHNHHTPPGDHRGWRQWTPACPCIPYRSSPPAAASAAPLDWGPWLSEKPNREKQLNTHTHTQIANHIGGGPLTFFSDRCLCRHISSAGALSHVWLWSTET